jgi:MFS family permease
MKTHIFSALSDKSFLYIWIGEIFTLIATNVFNFFLLLVVFDITHSNTANSAVVLSITIPSIIFGVIAGAYVDRWNKKKVLLVVNLSRAVLLVFLAFYVNNLFCVYAVAFIFSFITQFFIPAELPILPSVVEQKYLYSANALFGMSIYGSILIAFVLAGPLIIFLKPFGVLVLLAIILVLASIFISFVRLKYSKIQQAEKRVEDANIFKDMKYTLSLISHTKDVSISIFFLALSQTLILVVATIAPGYASSVLGIPVVQFPLLFVAPAALGVVIGAWIITNYCHERSKHALITVGIFLSAISMLFLPYGSKVASKAFVHTINLYLPKFLTIDILHIVIVLAFILGFSNSLVFVPANTLLQMKTSEEFRGKVYGFLNAFVGILSLLPIIIVGGLADIIGVSAVITGIGLFLLSVGVLRVALK